MFDDVAHKRTVLIPVQRVDIRADRQEFALHLGQHEVDRVALDVGKRLRNDGLRVWRTLDADFNLIAVGKSNAALCSAL